MVTHAKKRSFEDPGVLRLRTSAWNSWANIAARANRPRKSTHPRGKRVQADPEELAKALAELGRS